MMKLSKIHFEEYLSSNEKEDLHPSLNNIYKKLPSNIHDLPNIIIYGPSGVGKYTQVLKILKRYSPSDLKYDKKMNIVFNKQNLYYKISDIHYEVDMSLLGCNSKTLWHELYIQLIDVINAKQDKCGVIVCKYFHSIHNDLLENFYSYMQDNNLSINIRFILISEHISFIPDKILNCCQQIHIGRPSKVQYEKCVNRKLTKVKVDSIINMKTIENKLEICIPHKPICDKLIAHILDLDNLSFKDVREMLYDILIYDLNIYECIWYIVSFLIKNDKVSHDKISKIWSKTYSFFKYYNNNYRPIYHMENYIYYLVFVIHNLSSTELI